ncbi:uncharacterized protein LOC106652746 [Trichogramma pretiosum]|uniref:uncharacterized protein LOC106652746 n=1 Tax=Trichogramma pretiosum TaxID=7493 RepID=UPI0006C9ACF0|nr:uncharacterized protein LOC106652746 [Trichogramma pretiosum]
MALTALNREYFLRKDNADSLINLVNYIKSRGIKQEHLEDGEILINMIRNGMRRFVNDHPSEEQLEEFKDTILEFKIDYLKEISLYRLNHGILAIACLEYLLFPGSSDQEYLELHCCGTAEATMLYIMLGPVREPNDDTKRAAASFFSWPDRLRENGCLEAVRSYLRGIHIDDDEQDYIRNKSIEVINEMAENVLDPVRDHSPVPLPVPVPVPANDQEPRPVSPINEMGEYVIDPVRDDSPVPPPEPVPVPADDHESRPVTPISVDDDYLSAVSDTTGSGYSQRIRYNTMDQVYFRQKIHADAIIGLQNYLIKHNIQRHHLSNDDILRDMIRATIGRRQNNDPTEEEKATLKRTIFLYTLDFLKAINLYRINDGILLVACIEFVLYPGKSDKKYNSIYLSSYPEAKKVYTKLCGIPRDSKLKMAILKSARRFLFCHKYARNREYLEKIRSYLRELVRREPLDDEEKKFIKQRTVQLITGNKDIQIIQPPENNTDPAEDHSSTSSKAPYMNREYFLKQSNADLIISLRKHLIDNDIKRENLDNKDDLIGILRAGTRRSSSYVPTTGELETLKRTLLNFTIDYLKEADLYRMNRGILLVACLEWLLLPGEDVEKYLEIYNCSQSMATKLYNKLCGFPEQHELDDATVNSAECFFRNKKFSNENGCLETVRLYLNGIVMDDEKLKFIKETSILLINDKAAMDTVQPPLIIKLLIEPNTPNLFAKHQSQLSAPKEAPKEAPVETSNRRARVVSVSRISDDFAQLYQPGQTVLAIRKSDSNFWPAKIMDIGDYVMYVKFFPLLGEMEVITMKEDVKAFSLTGIHNTIHARSPDLTRECFMNALALACAELQERMFC